VDKTGLTGAYDFDVTFMPTALLRARPPASGEAEAGSVVPASEPGMTFIEAVEHQLGLKLVPGKGPLRCWSSTT